MQIFLSFLCANKKNVLVKPFSKCPWIYFKQYLKAPKICHGKANMKFPAFSCFFLINIFSFYLDSLLSCAPADKHADAHKCKLLLF